MAEKKLFLLDAYALIFRAYYAFIRNPRINSKGLNTSAMFGFVNSLEEVLRNQKPTHIAVAFDHKSPNVRVQEYPFYKANRDETPEDIKLAEPWIREIIKAYNIPIIELEGYEADDVIGTLSKIAEKEDFKVYMMTPDKDFGQLVSENIFMFKPGRQGKKAEVLGPAEICEKYTLDNPEQFIDILGLMGDAVDNIPGVKGVGEKTAMKLISEYKSIEGVYENIDSIKGKLKEKLEADKEKAAISKKLATIILDAPIELDEAALVLEKPNKERLSEIFSDLEFRTLGRRILGEEFTVSTPSKGGQQELFAFAPEKEDEEASDLKTLENTPHKYELIDTAAKRKVLIDNLLLAKEYVFDTETTGLDTIMDDIVGIAFSYKTGEAYYVPLPEDQTEATSILAEFHGVFTHPTAVKIAHNLKFDIKVLMKYDVEVLPPLYDTMLAHYVANSGARHKMDLLAVNYLQYSPMPIENLIGKKGPKQKTMRSVPLDILTEYASEDADITLQLKPVMQKLVDDRSEGDVLQGLELPLIPVLAEMEFEGINVDTDFLNAYSETLGKEVLSIKEQVFKIAGAEFNMDSPRQLGEILFTHLKLPYTGQKTKTGQYSTNEEVLSGLKDEHEIIPLLLEYREITKLKSTYIDSIPLLVKPVTGRVHTTFSQTVAATGRLSSLKPNLQNIPIRTARGREIRKAFIPRDDNHTLLAADYSQIELRIICEISGDENMMAAFVNGEDIHAATASKVFGVPLDEVTKDQRRQAKAVNFGLAYGQSSFGLAQTLGIKRTEARAIIDNYFEQFPRIKDYMTTTIEFAREHGYVKTIMDRRRYLRDINSKNHTVRAGAERNAINSPIQGSAADMIKKAMIDIHHEMKAQQFKSKMILQVHDELVFDVENSEMEKLKSLVEEKMKNAISGLKVPIVVDMGTGANWLEAH
jgi:DNA polymerase-1